MCCVANRRHVNRLINCCWYTLFLLSSLLCHIFYVLLVIHGGRNLHLPCSFHLVVFSLSWIYWIEAFLWPYAWKGCIPDFYFFHHYCCDCSCNKLCKAKPESDNESSFFFLLAIMISCFTNEKRNGWVPANGPSGGWLQHCSSVVFGRTLAKLKTQSIQQLIR